MDVRINPSLRLAGVRHVGPCNEIGPAFHRLQDILASGPYWHQSGPWFGLYPAATEDPTGPDNISFAACKFTGDLPDGLEWVDVPEAEVAVYLHLGPYENLPKGWQAAYAAVGQSGRTPSDAFAIESYLNDPGSVAPSDLKTEILIPVT